MIFQNYALFPHMNVRENIAFGLDVKKMPRVERDRKVDRIRDMFGLSEFDGQARLGEVDINKDGSFKAQIPANTPVRLQLIDKFGMALATSGPGGDTASEPVWIQGRSGEARICGGCHEDRT